MQSKTLLTVGLLIFVAVAVVTIVLKGSPSKSTSTATEETSADASPSADALVVYYFHGETRCPTCRKIEAYTHEAIQEGFADELASGDIEWRLANYEAPANAQLATDYEVASPTVILVRSSDGESANWRNLTRVWELVGDKDAFAKYIQKQTQEMLSRDNG